ncbi:DUF1934 domain-containing protein [Paenibacillus cremeus]|uniref:DUF1934 domain-containing protein n=1 Tax=Paenibacillus cremeus TaxID=2163881 RepID=A0A559KFD6_9BACL|nr:DUF1934 domain-containing protein [Paenibacillus cremeus]TVY10835.1 DUF1934 domain-containing protein [Paenibacillus cremeus]
MPDKQEGTTTKRQAQISILSQSGNEQVKQHVQGELFPKEKAIYLRYQEPAEAEMGRTFTTIRIDSGQLRIIRQGDVKFEQTFEKGARIIGYIETPQGQLETETVTTQLEVHLPSNPAETIRARWAYQLFVMGESAGEFSLELTVVPS